MSNILAVIVTYFPEKKLLTDNVNSFIEYVDKVLIWENTPAPKNKDVRYIKHSKISYCGTDENVGISKALNYALKYAKTNGYDYILTMDQDSCFENFQAYRDAAISKCSSETCLIGPQINTICKHDLFINIKDDIIITSGTLAKTSTFEKIGGYCEDFKIDAIDMDICVKAQIMKIPIYVYQGCNLQQNFGNPKSIKLFGRKITTCGYNTLRLEGIFRNHIIVFRRYRLTFIKKVLFAYYKHIISGIIFIERNKFSKLLAIVRGTYKGLLFNI